MSTIATTTASETKGGRKDKVKDALIGAIKAKKQANTQAAKSHHTKELAQASITLAATDSKQAAIEACIAKVDAIVEECYANNRRFRDSTFDLKNDAAACIVSSGTSNNYDLYLIDGARRVGELVKNPVFFLDGVSPDDIKQVMEEKIQYYRYHVLRREMGGVGDCWHIAALAVVCNIPGLLEQLCVKRNEEVGVYGFIFFRDGDWISTVVDDQLFYIVDGITNKTKLVYGSCYNPRETWLPLLEKAYAKIHGDYESLDGGHTGDGIEDLTGGVSTVILTSDILNKDRFWKEEMLQVNKTIVMGCSIMFTDGTQPRTGLIPSHAYSVLQAVEYQGERLVHIRNPWGKVEWNGDWSDDSDKWTPEAIEALNARTKDDGRFWMTYDDFLRIWTNLDRVRVFDSTWQASTTWIPYCVEPRSSGKFELTLTESSDVVLAMCQPDTRYFASQKQPFKYKLAFHIFDEKNKLIKRAKVTAPFTFRSVNCEVKLGRGKYTIVPKVAREALAVEEKEEENADEGEEKTDEAAAEFAKAMRDRATLFDLKKATNAAKMAKARSEGKTLVGVDEFDEADCDVAHDADDEDDLDDWELMLGLRAYSHDPAMTLEGIAGPHPVKKDEKKDDQKAEDKSKDKEDEEEEWETEVEEPEEVTPSRKDKKKANKKKADKKFKKMAKED